MPTDWPGEIDQIVREVEVCQDELSQIFAEKSQTVGRGTAAEVSLLAEREARTAVRLQQAVQGRERLLQRARQQGWPGHSLRELAGATRSDQAPGLQERIDRARQKASQLQRTSWAQWVFAQRCFQHYRELADWLAHGGQKPATYEAGSGRDQPPTGGQGGVVLDACA